MAASKRATAFRIQWTGKNLAAIRKTYKHVRHYPEKASAAPMRRDWSQHPDNLHVTTNEGHTVIAEIGDYLVRDAKGRVVVEPSKAPRAPRALRVVPPGSGQTYEAEGRG